MPPFNVWVKGLSWLTLPALLRIWHNYGRFNLRYTAPAQGSLLILLALITKTCRLIPLPDHVAVDDPDSPRHEVQSLSPNRFTYGFFAVYAKLINSLPYDPRVRRERVKVNFHKIAGWTTFELLTFLELAKQWELTNGGASHRLIIVSPDAVLASTVFWTAGPTEFVYPWSLRHSLVMRLARSFIRCLTDGLSKQYPPADGPPAIAVAVPGGLDPTDRASPLFWWPRAGIPLSQITLFYDRPERVGSRFVKQVNHWGMRCVVMNKQAVTPATQHLWWQPAPGPTLAIKRLWLQIKVYLWGVTQPAPARWLACQTMDALSHSARIEDFLTDFNIRGLMHYQDAGMDFLSLACDAVGAARIGLTQSHYVWPEAAVARLSHVYFAWGSNHADILRSSVSCIDHVLIAGCPVPGAYPGSPPNEDVMAERAAVIAQGATRILALFDTSLPCNRFYSFFLQRVIDDPRWGMLIKPKIARLPWVREYHPELQSLYEQALATGRVRLLDARLSPADAAGAADLSVSVDINSASVVAALAGHRAIHLDYLRLQEGPLYCWASFHHAGANRLVFHDENTLWDSLNRYYDPGAIPQLGMAPDSLLARIDPFRDGHAGQRIGDYLRWYLDGLEQGLDRDGALTQASHKYAEKWGR